MGLMRMNQLKGFIPLLLILTISYAFEVVATTNTLAMLARPILTDWKVTTLMPPGASPLFWKPSFKQVEKAIQADLFIQTAHWPYEVQIAKKRNERGFTSIPNVTVFSDPAVELEALGYAILRMPNGELNPHGWWIYAPNAFQIMTLVTVNACSLNPSSCGLYVKNLAREIEASKEVIKRCVYNIEVKKVIVILPIEEYAVANFGIRTDYIVQPKGVVISGVVIHEALKHLRSADGVVISEVSANVPITKIIVRYAHLYHKPIYRLHVLWGQWRSYHEYLKGLCRGLETR